MNKNNGSIKRVMEALIEIVKGGCQKVRSESQRQSKINHATEVCICTGWGIRGRGNCIGSSPEAGGRERGSFKGIKICGIQSTEGERDHWTRGWRGEQGTVLTGFLSKLSKARAWPVRTRHLIGACWFNSCVQYYFTPFSQKGQLPYRCEGWLICDSAVSCDTSIQLQKPTHFPFHLFFISLCLFSVQSPTIVILARVVLRESSVVKKAPGRTRGPWISWYFTLSKWHLHYPCISNCSTRRNTDCLFLELGSGHSRTCWNSCLNKTTWEPDGELGGAGTCSNI